MNKKGRGFLSFIFILILIVIVVNSVDLPSFDFGFTLSLNALSLDTSSPFEGQMNPNSPAGRINQQLEGVNFQNIGNLADTLTNAMPGNNSNNRGNTNNNSGLLSAR